MPYTHTHTHADTLDRDRAELLWYMTVIYQLVFVIWQTTTTTATTTPTTATTTWRYELKVEQPSTKGQDLW